MIAATSIADTVAILAFATFLFLLGVGVIRLLKFLFLLISGKPQPEEPQSLYVTFETEEEWDEQRNALEMQRFGNYLASRVRSKRLGEFDGGEFEGKRAGLYFFGPDTRRMWEEIEMDVRTFAPERPLEVTYDFGRMRGGRQIVDIAEDGPRHPQPLPDFETTEPDSGISPAWIKAWHLGNLLWLSGFTGLFFLWFVRLITGVSELEMMRSGIGSFVVWTLSGMFLGGTTLALVCVSKGQLAAKRPNPGPIGRAQQGPVLPSWISNRVILAIVAALIAGIAITLRMK